MKRTLTNGEEIKVEGEPYKTCGSCLVKHRCGRLSGDSPLPSDYLVNPECNGYIMVEKAMELSNTPPEFRDVHKDNYTFDKPKDEKEENKNIFLKDKAFKNTRELVSNGANIGFISRNMGTGKTRTALTIAKEFMFSSVMDPKWFDYENPLFYFLKYSEWANSMRDMYSANDEEAIIKRLRQKEMMKKVPLLVIDDIGSGRITNYIRDLTYEVIDYRKEHKKSTIFTTNLTKEMLNSPDKLGDRITSRLYFNSVIVTLDGQGKDKREETTYYL